MGGRDASGTAEWLAELRAASVAHDLHLHAASCELGDVGLCTSEWEGFVRRGRGVLPSGCLLPTVPLCCLAGLCVRALPVRGGSETGVLE